MELTKGRFGSLQTRIWDGVEGAKMVGDRRQ
jgi:hypothetical protein